MTHTTSAATPTATPTLPRTTVVLLAAAVGSVIANLYYAQPLEHTLARAFEVSDRALGLAMTLILVGYAVGLATLVPLGDLLERRRLMVPMLAVNVAGLVAMATATGYAVFVVAAALVGVTAVAVQVMVPFAAELAPPERRGRVIGTVMSGLLVGVLLSRTVAGLVSGAAGWRAVFWFAAALTALVTVLLWWRLPVVQPRVRMRYPALLGSVLALVREEPVLRRRMLYGGLCFASFNAFWTASAFMLAGAPYRWTTTAIGLFALVGVAGALGARLAGRLVDRGHASRAMPVFLLATALSFGLIALGQHWLAALVVGVVVMDLASQAVHISNQNVVYALRPQARSRINTAYMTSYFVAGSVGSGLSAVVYPVFGWTGVGVLGFALPALAALTWFARDSKGSHTAHQGGQR
ncbi:MFS transporter [Actinophytocola xanthii]|uniref:MFS transporter n=1 Tax=Actinophytocola xanthii TaxID=1912961 RepID=A0A1Q8CSA6_9PSEU|nr:MFS transporter [Actinophytocola xanthii]OLF17252.1 MFS transporter [Actinophytocola xanthii]